jgi:hypothetical protein
MKAGKFVARSSCSSSIEPDTSITHRTSTDGVVTCTILSVFTGFCSVGGFGSPNAGGGELMLYSVQPARSARMYGRMRISLRGLDEAADRYPRDRPDLVKQMSIVRPGAADRGNR